MALLEEYQKTMQSIRNLTVELHGLEDQLPHLEQEVNSLKGKLTQLEQESQYKMKENYNRVLQERINNRVRELRDQISSKKSQIDLIQAKLKSNYQVRTAAINAFTFPKENEIMSEALEILDANKAVFDVLVTNGLDFAIKSIDMRPEVDDPVKLLDTIQQLCVTLKSIAPELVEQTQSFYIRVIRLLMFDISTDRLSLKTQTFLMLLNVVLLVVVFCVEPVGVSSLFLGLLLAQVGVSTHKNIKLGTFALPYAKLKTFVEYYRILVNEIKQKRIHAVEQTPEKVETFLRCLQEEISTLQLEIDKVPDKIKSCVSEADLTEDVKQLYNAQRESVENEITRVMEEIEDTKTYVEKDMKQLANLKSRAELQRSLVYSTYLRPETPGNSRFLTKSFLLGLNEDTGELLQFDYGGESTFIVYRGANCSANKKLITMMMVQLLSTMSITSLRINLVDEVSSGADYAMFRYGNLAEQITISGTKEQTADLVEDAHKELLERNSSVLIEATDIEMFNTKRLELHSIPLDYRFMIIQDPDTQLLQDTKLHQLCRNGPRVGIIPIIFMSHSNVNLLAHENQDIRTGCCNLIRIISQYFMFTCETESLIQHGKTLQDAIIKELRGA